MSSIDEILPILHRKTVNKKIEWKLSGDNEIFIRIGENIIEIDEISDDEGGFVERIALRNKEGKLLEVKSYAFGTEKGNMLEEIFTSGKRASLRIDEILDDIKKYLSDL